jgi:hypothetical protein
MQTEVLANSSFPGLREISARHFLARAAIDGAPLAGGPFFAAALTDGAQGRPSSGLGSEAARKVKNQSCAARRGLKSSVGGPHGTGTAEG